jgi:hypothetical protein
VLVQVQVQVLGLALVLVVVVDQGSSLKVLSAYVLKLSIRLYFVQFLDNLSLIRFILIQQQRKKAQLIIAKYIMILIKLSLLRKRMNPMGQIIKRTLRKVSNQD